MSQVLQEFVDSGNQRLRVDRDAGIIRGVKLLGLASRNGRRYRENALLEAMGLYEGAKVNINHPKGHPLSPRDYQDRLGVVRGVHFRAGEGLFADLHFNPKHLLSEQLVWDAEHAPQNVGMSHNVLARTSHNGADTVVEAITKVQSIDLVADPATTSGLYEHAQSQELRVESQEPDGGSSFPALDSRLLTLDSLTLDQLRRQRPDLVRELAFQPQFEEVSAQLDEALAREEALRRRERIFELLQEHSLPFPSRRRGVEGQIVSEHFMETLMNAADANTLQRLVEERAQLVRSAARWNDKRSAAERRPRSRDQVALASAGVERPVQSGQELAAALRGN